jgi:pimeloyl-ACP methyl ester carboxylesterase
VDTQAARGGNALRDPFHWAGGRLERTLERPEGTRLRVTESEGGSGTPIVLVHGFGMSLTCWGMVAPELEAAGHRVIAYDHRGHGASTVGGDGVTSKALFGDLRAVLDEIAAEPAVVVCHSMGNFVALGALSDLRRRPPVAGLVLVSPVTGDSTREAPTARLQGPLVRRGIAQRLAAHRRLGSAMARMSLGPHADESVVAATRHALRSIPMTAAPMIGVLQHESVVDGLSTIDVPTIVLTGTHDRTTPERHARLIASHMSDVQLRFVPEVGHMTPWESPAQVLLAIASMVRRTRDLGA